jgi:hypothetical protein
MNDAVDDVFGLFGRPIEDIPLSYVLSSCTVARHLVSPDHTRYNFDPVLFKQLVDRSVDKIFKILKLHPDIGAFAACGHSGLMLMGALSYVTSIPQICVRKSHDTNNDRSVGGGLVNGWLGCGKYMIIDDFICSGMTVERIVMNIDATAKALNERIRDDAFDSPLTVVHPRPVAMLLYKNNYNTFAHLFQTEVYDVETGTYKREPELGHEALVCDVPTYGLDAKNEDIP